MDNKQKILVAGDVKGNFKQLFNRVDNINKKNGPFELLLCVGEFFGENNDELIAYKNGFKNVPVPTYILGPTLIKNASFYENLNDNEICTNLTYLGKRGLYTVSTGIKIAYLSGLQSSSETDTNECNFTKDDVVAVRNSCIVNKSTMGDYRGVDILITSQWPKGIDEKIEKETSQMISWLALEVKPRYHFCGLNGIYYERLPYRNTIGNTTQMELATRFISLASVGNVEKNKYIYALSLMPVDKMRVIELIQKTTNETQCPYNQIDFKPDNYSQTIKDGSQYFYDMKNYDADGGYGKRKQSGGDFQKKRHRPTFDQEKCWFCLSSENVEKHLVISIGENFYLALAKGPINENHILILSVTHIQSSALLSDDDWTELKKFKNAIKKYFKSKNQVCTFFERNYKCAHLQINAIGIDADKEWQIKNAFEDKAGEYDLPFENIPELTEPQLLPQGPFFVAELPNIILLTRQMKMFPLHFGREVFCSENVLNCEDKCNWKDCLLSKDEEIELVKRFRENFKTFDFTL